MLCPLLLPGRPVLIDDESRSCPLPPARPKQTRLCQTWTRCRCQRCDRTWTRSLKAWCIAESHASRFPFQVGLFQKIWELVHKIQLLLCINSFYTQSWEFTSIWQFPTRLKNFVCRVFPKWNRWWIKQPMCSWTTANYSWSQFMVLQTTKRHHNCNVISIFVIFFLREHKMDVHLHKYTDRKMKRTSATLHLTLRKEADNMFGASLSKSLTFFTFSEQITAVLEMLLLVNMF